MKSFEEKRKETAERLAIPVERLPHHIAIIMDGNGRWAVKKGLPRVAGHQQGGKTVERISQYCVNIGIEHLTLYSFSAENWKRPKQEVDFLMSLYTRYLADFRPNLMKNNVKLLHLGKLDNLPAELQKELTRTIQETSGNNGMTFSIALNYSGRDEIIDAVKKLAQQCKNGKLNIDDINENCVNQNLYQPQLPEPDLLIRTANERRVSNFLLWQISYTEFYVCKKFWPDFTEKDLDKAIIDFAQRERRFGNINAAGTFSSKI